MKEETTRGLRKKRSGVVVSNKMEKTLVVRVERNYRHPLYGKVMKEAKKYYAHDENAAETNIGDAVTIEECRPMSKLKRWRVVRELT
jgi:small subunit ribosomal protein S17